MKQPPNEDIIEIIDCDIGRRPAAPGIDDLTSGAVAMTRTPATIEIQFPRTALKLVESFAAAERVCCAGIDWQVEATSAVTLTISGTGTALDAIQQL